MNAQTQKEITKALETAIKQLNQAKKNINKAEELAFYAHNFKMSDGLEEDSLNVSKIADSLHVLKCFVDCNKFNEQ